jgi:hypothetical protein
MKILLAIVVWIMASNILLFISSPILPERFEIFVVGPLSIYVTWFLVFRKK